MIPLLLAIILSLQLPTYAGQLSVEDVTVHAHNRGGDKTDDQHRPRFPKIYKARTALGRLAHAAFEGLLGGLMLPATICQLVFLVELFAACFCAAAFIFGVAYLTLALLNLLRR